MNNRKLLPTKHASATDWDFTNPHYDIEEADFVSPPSSFCWRSPSGLKTEHALCKAAGTHKLPEGRLVSWFRQYVSNRYIFLHFRNTSAIGTANTLNGYYVRFYPTESYWRTYEYLAGALQRSWYKSKDSYSANTWRRFRLSWWLSWGVLQVRLEHEVGDEWVQDGDDLSITDPLFGAEDIQRCGQGAKFAVTIYNCYVDDTEIWEYEE